MRCKLGDMALIAADEFPENVGKLVEITDYAEPWPFDQRPHWAVRSLGARLRNICVDAEEMPTGKSTYCEIAEVADADLIPIRDPGDDAVDEVLQLLPVPHKEMA